MSEVRKVRLTMQALSVSGGVLEKRGALLVVPADPMQVPDFIRESASILERTLHQIFTKEDNA